MRRDRHFTDYEPVTKSGPAKVLCEDVEESFEALHRGRRSPEEAAAVADSNPSRSFDAAPDEAERVEESLREQVALGPETRRRVTVSEKKAAPKENWLKRRGHALSYLGLFLFTAVLYFRPYELIP